MYQVTDVQEVDSSSEIMKNTNYSQNLITSDFVTTFKSKQMEDEIILILNWNPIWLQNQANLIVQVQVTAYILANGGTDPKNSGFIYHFQSYQTLLECRDSMRLAIPAAFHASPNTIYEYNQTYNLNIAPSIHMADAWLIFKTPAVLATDYSRDTAFFYK